MVYFPNLAALVCKYVLDSNASLDAANCITIPCGEARNYTSLPLQRRINFLVDSGWVAEVDGHNMPFCCSADLQQAKEMTMI